jgi:hypothetical protein
VAGSASKVVLSPAQVYWWNEKYRPRKPKYFNRIHTGYEWNKYNQTHYDHDNPPPKVVQGYKFNIFYPDLINKEEAPTYSLAKVTLKSAPPPHEGVLQSCAAVRWPRRWCA